MLCVILEGFLLKEHDVRIRWLAGSCYPPFRLLVEDQHCVWNYCSNKYSWTVHNIVEAMITHALISYGRRKELRKKEDRFYLKLPPCQWYKWKHEAWRLQEKKKRDCRRSHNHKLQMFSKAPNLLFLFCRFWYQNIPLKAIKHTETLASLSRHSNPLIYTNFLNPAAFLLLFFSKFFDVLRNIRVIYGKKRTHFFVLKFGGYNNFLWSTDPVLVGRESALRNYVFSWAVRGEKEEVGWQGNDYDIVSPKRKIQMKVPCFLIHTCIWYFQHQFPYEWWW